MHFSILDCRIACVCCIHSAIAISGDSYSLSLRVNSDSRTDICIMDATETFYPKRDLNT